MLSAFSGNTVTAEVVRANINHPSNTFNAQSDAHESFYHLEWGIETQLQPGGQVSYLTYSMGPTLRILSQQWKIPSPR
jgi:hypothetical protein